MARIETTEAKQNLTEAWHSEYIDNLAYFLSTAANVRRHREDLVPGQYQYGLTVPRGEETLT